MRHLMLMGIFAMVFMLGCTSVPDDMMEEEMPEEATLTDSEVEAIAEPTAETLESDLDTSGLDQIEEDLDLLILE